MRVITTDIEGLLIIEPTVYGDGRGYFYESFRSDVLQDFDPNLDFVQDNQSCSHKGILRGLHFQKNPYAQGKLVRVIQGAVLDVAVDIRKGSKTYGKHLRVRLDGDNKRMLYVPKGFAHGFVTLEDNTLFLYKCTNYYHKESECSVKWDSPELGINWGIENPVLSSKDLNAPLFSDFISPF